MLWEAGGSKMEKTNGREGHFRHTIHKWLLRESSLSPLLGLGTANSLLNPIWGGIILPTSPGRQEIDALQLKGFQLLNEIPGHGSTVSIPTLIDRYRVLIGTNLLVIDYQILWDTRSVWCTLLCRYCTKTLKAYLTLFLRDSCQSSNIGKGCRNWDKCISLPLKADSQAVLNPPSAPCKRLFHKQKSEATYILHRNIQKAKKITVCNLQGSHMEHSSNSAAKKYVSFKLTATTKQCKNQVEMSLPGADRNWKWHWTTTICHVMWRTVWHIETRVVSALQDSHPWSAKSHDHSG